MTLFSSMVYPRCLYAPPPPAVERVIGQPPQDGQIAAGTAYTDGALRGTVPRARRAGWAFAVDGGGPLWGKWGR